MRGTHTHVNYPVSAIDENPYLPYWRVSMTTNNWKYGPGFVHTFGRLFQQIVAVQEDLRKWLHATLI